MGRRHLGSGVRDGRRDGHQGARRHRRGRLRRAVEALSVLVPTLTAGSLPLPGRLPSRGYRRPTEEGVLRARRGTRPAHRVGDPIAWDVLIDAARAIEPVPELLGLSPHLIAT